MHTVKMCMNVRFQVEMKLNNCHTDSILLTQNHDIRKEKSLDFSNSCDNKIEEDYENYKDS